MWTKPTTAKNENAGAGGVDARAVEVDKVEEPGVDAKALEVAARRFSRTGRFAGTTCGVVEYPEASGGRKSEAVPEENAAVLEILEKNGAEEPEKLEKFLVKVLKQRLKQKKTPVPEEVKSLEK